MGKKKNSKNNLLVNLVVDKSSSMASLTDATIDGLNEFLDAQLSEKGETRISLTLFNADLEVRYAGTNIKHVPDFSRHGTNNYRTGGLTALYDAVGVSVNGVDRWLRNNPDWNGRVLTVIWTDGMENASKEFNQWSVNNLIERKQDQGWVFQFMGTGNDGWRSAQNFHSIPLSNRNRVEHDWADQRAVYATLNSSVAGLRSTGAWNYSSDEQLANADLIRSGK